MKALPAVDHGILFFPRGGSSLVVKNLTEQTLAAGRPARIFAGSLGQPGAYSHAPTFYEDLPLTVADYNPAATAHTLGADALLQPVPMHPSYEDRTGVPDRVFAAVAPATADAIEAYWRRHLTTHHAGQAGLLHLHHLTPLHGITQDGHRPVVTTLHGTELKFLNNALRRLQLADALGLSIAALGEQYRNEPRATLRRITQTANAPGLDETETLLTDRWHMWTHASFGDGSTEKFRKVTARSNPLESLSTGERRLATMLPLLAAAWSMYSGEGFHGPRLLSVDEIDAAFDEPNLRQVLALLRSWDFDVLATAPFMTPMIKQEAGQVMVHQVVTTGRHRVTVPWLWQGHGEPQPLTLDLALDQAHREEHT